jgi:preprotein translocase subunit SecD
MAIDKLKYFNRIKRLVMLIWLAYAIVFNTKFAIYLPDVTDYFQKDNLEIKKGIALIGGSNVETGLSAELISTNFYECLNLGLSAEKEAFSEYINYINGKVSTDLVVYSPAYIWSESPIDKDDSYRKKFFKLSEYIPPISIISQIREAISPSSSLIEFNSFGDQVGYNCPTGLFSFKINQQKFTSSNDVIIEEIIARVEKLKETTGADKIFIRIPPVYAEEDKKKLISKCMELRIKALKSAGIIVVRETIVSSDKSLFCDNFHPNEKGREFFSMELKTLLQKMKL